MSSKSARRTESTPNPAEKSKSEAKESKARKIEAAKIGELEAVVAEKRTIVIGPPRLTRFERARIIGARALQLSINAPSFVQITKDIRDPISLAIAELEAEALPISIRRMLPDGAYQDIPISWLT